MNRRTRQKFLIRKQKFTYGIWSHYVNKSCWEVDKN